MKADVAAQDPRVRDRLLAQSVPMTARVVANPVNLLGISVSTGATIREKAGHTSMVARILGESGVTALGVILHLGFTHTTMITLSHWMSVGFAPPAISNIMLGGIFLITHSHG